ncbi:hypothetical protein GCM10027160_51530 [Streptomyces calidiresistens]|uniref:DUF1707 domain-containing protein n=1 Tax=Streptomyces calidiresistens TaxID=1485586 RepID=A0A7W3T302_9ACTN|nr:DUF1707 domain-containing protein [Streptomyces calidiresistens]MBB0229843.1 DUF1707 domain-containing protein [Streptomyces calidiresistens]
MTSPDRFPNPDLRASDSDREAVAERLREAAGEGRIDLTELDERLERTFAAKTYRDLEPLTADLPPTSRSGGAGPGRAIVSSTGPVAPASGPVSPPPVLVVKGGFAGSNREGHWEVPPTVMAHGGVGGVKLDLTRARVHQPVTDFALHGDMGGVTLVVPEGWTVVVGEVSTGMGGFTNKATEPPVAGAPVVRVSGRGDVGGVTVRRPNMWERRRLRKELEEGRG